MKIIIGADHCGFELKKELIHFLNTSGYEVIDAGAYSFDENDDFNDPALSVAKFVARDKESKGILLCGSGHGMTMQANRIKGARAINAYNEESVRLSREHNDANIICFAAKNSELDFKQLIQIFLNTNFDNKENHLRRIVRLDKENYA